MRDRDYVDCAEKYLTIRNLLHEVDLSTIEFEAAVSRRMAVCALEEPTPISYGIKTNVSGFNS